MIKATTVLLGAGLLAASLAVPLSARAEHGDEGLAFVIGAAVGHALADGDVRVHYRPNHYYRHAPVVRDWRWHQRQKTWHRKFQREHRYFHRDDRRDHRSERRHHRRDDRRDHRRDDRGRHHGRRHHH